MTAPGTHFTGPIYSGPSAGEGGAADTVSKVGTCVLTQTALLTQNSTTNVSATFPIPKHSQILDFLVDNIVVWNSGTSAGLTIGTAALGTQYASSINLLTAGVGVSRTVAPVSPSAAQLTAMADTGTNQSVVVTVAVSGATSTGTTRVTMRYVQTNQWDTN